MLREGTKLAAYLSLPRKVIGTRFQSIWSIGRHSTSQAIFS